MLPKMEWTIDIYAFCIFTWAAFQMSFYPFKDEIYFLRYLVYIVCFDLVKNPTNKCIGDSRLSGNLELSIELSEILVQLLFKKITLITTLSLIFLFFDAAFVFIILYLESTG